MEMSHTVMLAYTVFLYLLLVCNCSLTQSYPRIIPIGFIYPEADMFRRAIAFATEQQNNDLSQRLFKLDVKTVELKDRRFINTWRYNRIVCELLKSGVFAFAALGDSKARPAFAAVAREMHMPFLNWGVITQETSNEFEVSIMPPTDEVVASIIINKKWKQVAFLYDSDYGMMKLHSICRYLTEAGATVSFKIIPLPSPESNVTLHAFAENVFATWGTKQDNYLVIDVLNSDRLLKALMELKAALKNDIACHVIVSTLLFEDTFAEKFKNTGLNITGIETYGNRNFVYGDFINKWKMTWNPIGRETEFSSDAAFAFESGLVITAAIESLLRQNESLFYGSFRRDKFWNAGYPGIYCIPAEDSENPDRPFLPFEYGRLIAQHVRQVHLNGITGNIEFDDHGRRVRFLVRVSEIEYNVPIALTSFTKLLWKHGVGFLQDRTTVNFQRGTRRDMDFANKTRIVTCTLAEPFVMYKPEAERLHGNDKFEGYCIDLLKLLSEKMDGFPYEIRLAKDGRTGSPDENGVWDGAIGEIIRGEADMAVSSLVINRAREKVVDFSKPFMTTGISIMIKKPDAQEISVFSFMQPLSSEVWMYTWFAYIGISVVLFLVSRFSPCEWKVRETTTETYAISNDFSFHNCLWFIFAAFMHQGIDILPKSLAGRIASSAWWFFTMIIVSSYTANLAAFLTLEKMRAPIESAEDLAKQTKIKYGIQDGGTTAQFFKDSTVQTYQRMWQFMTSQVPSVFVASYAEGINRVRESKGRYAFLLESTTNDYINNRQPCDTMKVGSNLNAVGYGVVTPIGSELKSRLNLAILELQEKGELKKLENKWWYEKSGGQCKSGAASDASDNSLQHSKVAGVFYLLFGGMLLAVFIAAIEFFERCRIQARKTNKTLKTSLRKHFTVAVHGWTEESLQESCDNN